MKKGFLTQLILLVVTALYPLIHMLVANWGQGQAQQTFAAGYYFPILLSLIVWGILVAVLCGCRKATACSWYKGVLGIVYLLFCVLFAWNVLEGQSHTLPVCLAFGIFCLSSACIDKLQQKK